MASFFALLLVIAAIGAVGLALLASDDGGGGGVSPVDQGDVDQQIQGLRDFLQEHTR
jgi:hypothetical protein